MSMNRPLLPEDIEHERRILRSARVLRPDRDTLINRMRHVVDYLKGNMKPDDIFYTKAEKWYNRVYEIINASRQRLGKPLITKEEILHSIEQWLSLQEKTPALVLEVGDAIVAARMEEIEDAIHQFGPKYHLESDIMKKTKG